MTLQYKQNDSGSREVRIIRKKKIKRCNLNPQRDKW